MTNLQQVAAQDARKYGLNPVIFQRQIGQESGFNPRARSGAGAIGVAQIMPATARSWGVNPNDPFAALDAAAKHMAGYVRQFGSVRNALIAYNAGPGRVGGKLPAETVNYVNKILGSGGGGAGPGGPALQPGGLRRQVYLPAKTKTDESAAAIDALLAHARAPGGSLLQNFVRNLDSGLYTSTTPGRTINVPSLSAQTDAGAGVRSGKLPKGVAHFDGKPVAAWIVSDLAWARQHGWTGSVSSGVRSFAEQTRIYNSGVRPAARPGTSNHEMTAFPGGAVDVTQAQQLAAILAKKPGGSLLKWAGAKDPVHFSHPHNGSY